MGKKSKRLVKRPSHITSHFPDAAFQHTQISISPIPSAAELEKYDQILPGAAERIISSFENQGSHRRDLEKKVIQFNINIGYLGWLSSTGLGFFTIGMGGYLLYNGHDITGLGSIVSTLATLVGIYYLGTRQQKDDLEQKRKSLQQ